MKGERFEITMRHCGICQQSTQHEVRACEGARVTICVRCLERASAAVMQAANRQARNEARRTSVDRRREES